MTGHSFSCIRGGLTIRGVYTVPGDDQSGGRQYPAVILSHGFGGCQEEMAGFAALFDSMGYATFRYDFCGGAQNGISDGEKKDMLLATEKADLCAVIGYAFAQPFVLSSAVVLTGLSMGGVVSALIAAENRYPVEKLVLLSPAFCVPDDARMGILAGAVYDPADPPEIIHTINNMQLSRAFHKEAAAMDILQAIQGYRGDVLICHGYDDPVVPFDYAVRAGEAYGEKAQLHLMAGVGHGFTPVQEGDVCQVIRQFMLGKRECFRIHVQITGSEFRQNGATVSDPHGAGDYEHLIYFGGYVNDLLFRGTILPGGCDTQTYRDGKRVGICADYQLWGMNGKGERCTFHVINRGTPDGFRPEIDTENEYLASVFGSWKELSAAVEGVPGGVDVCFFAK